ncbi:MAG TPA: laccase domain-containing protein, partial [Phenylobacterium sp.]|nr:laccase domain-containing protein [Phenylobacterium sp.]
EAPWGDARPEGDAVVTREVDVLCGALAADCAPILFADAEARVVAAAHAGWKGALGGIVESTVAAMRGLGARPHRTVAVVGPCIGPASYEVGLEFMETFVAANPANARFFAAGETADKRMFDLPAFVLWRLRAAGIDACAWVGADTCADESQFFSNRRAFRRGEPDFGRLLSAIVLE